MALPSYSQAVEEDLCSKIHIMCQENDRLKEELAQIKQKLQDYETRESQIKGEKEDSKIDGNSPTAFDSHDVCYEVPLQFRPAYNLTVLLIQKGQYAAATTLCKNKIQDLVKSYGSDNVDVATMLSLLVLIYRDQHKFEEAIHVMYKVLAIREKKLNKNDLTLAATLNNMAVLYSNCKEYEMAEPFCRRSLDIRERILGKNHPDVGKQLNNLALICQHQGKYEDMLECYDRSLEIYEKCLGHDDPTFLKALKNLASICMYMRRDEVKNAGELEAKLSELKETVYNK